MIRKTQTQVFTDTFPHVDIKSTQGMLMFQGFLAGYERGISRTNNERKTFKENIKSLVEEVKGLKDQIKNLNILIKTQDLWQRTGDEN